MREKKKKRWQIKIEQRRVRAQKLCWIYAGQSKTIDQWIADLKNEKPKVRRSAVDALGYIGFDAREAGVPALKIALQDKNEWVREGAKEALKKIQQK
jgi:HEAT repeat protein